MKKFKKSRSTAYEVKENERESLSIQYWASHVPAFNFSIVTFVGILIYAISYGTFAGTAASLTTFSVSNSTQVLNITSTLTVSNDFSPDIPSWQFNLLGLIGPLSLIMTLSLLVATRNMWPKFSLLIVLLGTLGDLIIISICFFGFFLTKIYKAYSLDASPCAGSSSNLCLQLSRSYITAIISNAMLLACAVLRLAVVFLFRHYNYPPEEVDQLDSDVELRRRRHEFDQIP